MEIRDAGNGRTGGPLAPVGRAGWVLVLFGIITVLFGLVALLRPFQAAVALAWAFGIVALAEGVVSVIALFDRDTPISKGWLALYAVASIAFGVLALVNPVATAGALLLVLAAWLVVAGVFRIVFAVRVRKAIRGEWLIALSGALAIALGLLFVGYPAAGLVAVTIWIGAIALLYGILQIVGGLRLRKWAKVS